MTRFMLGALAALMLGGMPAPAAPPADPAACAAALKRIDDGVRKHDLSSTLAAVSFLRASLLALRSAPSSGAACLRGVEGRAWSLERDARAERRDWDFLVTEVDGLWSAAERCGIKGASAAADDAAWALDRAGRKIASLRSAPAARPACSAPAPKLDALLAELASGAYDSIETERLNEAVGGDLVNFSARQAFSSGDVSACDRWSAVDRAFVVKTQAAARCGTMQCQSKFHADALTRAFFVRGPGLERECLDHISGYSGLFNEAHTKQVCAIIAADIEDPERLCSRLIPRFLSPGKRQTCVSEFSRNLSYDDEKTCERLESWEGGWLERCRDMTAFRRARAAGRAELCGDREVCWLYMGRWSQKYLPVREAEMSRRWCEALRGVARERRAEAASLLAAAEAALDRAPRGAATDALRARAARLRQDIGSLGDWMTSRSPDSPIRL